jgi:REP element-mobilizing transposase RayT
VTLPGRGKPVSNFRRSSYTPHKIYKTQHRFEHWYRDNQVYFITARCRDRYPAFASEAAKQVFWDRFQHYTSAHTFEPWVTSLLDNHYHTVGYIRVGEELGPMMRKLHGSTAKLANDLLPERRVPFWRAAGKSHHDYFDGCLRDARQLGRSYRYVLLQSTRHGVARHWREYSHTRVTLPLDEALRRATSLNALLKGVPYRRYEGR